MKYLPGSSCIAFANKNQFVKLAPTGKARKALRLERVSEKKVATDTFWSKYLTPTKYGPGNIYKVTPLGSPYELPPHGDLGILIELEKRQTWTETKPQFRLTSLTSTFPNHPGLDTAYTLLRGSPLSSTHGDLHRGNILLFGAPPSIKIIDWGNYRRMFWTKYDPMHFEVTDHLKNTETKKWSDILTQSHKFVSLKNEYNYTLKNILTYAVCRCELEASQDISQRRLNTHRKQKYSNILSLVINIFRENNDKL